MKTFKAIITNQIPVVCKIVFFDNANLTYKAGHSSGKLNAGQEKQIKDPETEFSFQLKDPGTVLNTGDILLLEPNGIGTVLFDSSSATNSVFLTNNCNSRCIMCPQPPKPDDDDYVRLSIETISLMEPETKVLGITGGEPTLLWDGLIEVLSACRSFIPKTKIQLLTNARSLKDYNKAEQLAAAGANNLSLCIPIYADVDAIHDEIVGSKGAFWETVEGIHNIARFHIPLEVRNVITKLNYHRLGQWSEFIYRGFPFADHIALMGLEPSGLALINLDKIWIDPIDYMPILRRSVKALSRRCMNVSIYNHQLCTLHRELWPFSRRSISEWKNIFFSECQGCLVKEDCGGFFMSSENIPMKGINKIPI